VTADKRLSRRQMLAFIALADAPVPDGITFGVDAEGPYIMLSLDTGAGARTWAAVLGAEVRHRPSSAVPGGTYWTVGSTTYAGWSISVTAVERPELDDATRSRLTALTDDGRQADTDLHTDMHPQPGELPAAPLPAGVEGFAPHGRHLDPGSDGVTPDSAIRPGAQPRRSGGVA
jgi:hypothetical protein